VSEPGPLLRAYRALPGPLRALAAKAATLGKLCVTPAREFLPARDVLAQIRHLPTSIHGAVRQARANRRLDRGLRTRAWAENLVLVAAVPKAASSVIGSGIAALLGQEGLVEARGYADYMLANKTSNLRAELVKQFPQGGVLKFHTRPSAENLAALRLLGLRTVVLMRHPADQLAALHCHMQTFVRAPDVPPLTEDAPVWYDHIRPLSKARVYPGAPAEEVLAYLIRDGYLQALLTWMADWLAFRDPARSMVATYEHFVADPAAFYDRLARFLFGGSVQPQTLEKARALADEYTRGRARSQAQSYERGYTGKQGVWRDYFSEENRADYCAVARAFVQHHTDAGGLLEVYPDLTGPRP